MIKIINILLLCILIQLLLNSIFFPTYYLNQIINYAIGEKISIKVVNGPMPLTAKLSINAEQTTNKTMVFFVAVAFSLIQRKE